MEAPQIVLLLIAVVGLAQAVFLMLLLRHEGKRAFRANRWLMVFAGAACLSFIEDISDVVLSAQMALYLAPFFILSTFAFVPSIYLYFCEVADRPVRHPLWHFAILVPMAGLSAAAVWIILNNFMPDPATSSTVEIDIELDVHLPLTIMLLVVFVSMYAQLITYMIKIWRVAIAYLRQASEQLGADQHALRRWIREILIGVSFIFVIFTATSMIDIFIGDSDWLTTIVQGAFALVFFRLSHLLALNPALFVQADWASEDEADEQPNVRNTNAECPEPSNGARAFLDDEDVERIAARLDRVVDETEILFDPLLSMPKLANTIGATPNQLSHVLNQHLGKSFFDFVNEVRTREASRLLIEEPDRTILDIATSVGFNSKSTFNLAFKKITGRTPSVYRNEFLEKSDA
ncbi:MAG: helix-turn-helix domain-containing protein [Thalassospira sp.]|uniref:AraC family transcriptional regulator n=1 Tax=Thalassospira sp. TaxID=1912094 RepID=UPI003A83C458